MRTALSSSSSHLKRGLLLLGTVILLALLCEWPSITLAALREPELSTRSENIGNQTVFSVEDSEQIYGVPPAIPLYGLEETPLRVKECIHGRVLYSTNDIYIGWSLDLYGEWCEQELQVVSQIVRPGQVAIDIGAHIGTFTLGLAEAVGPTGKVIAFEPQRVLYQMLCANAALNGYTWVYPYRNAVSDRPGGTIHVPEFDLRLQRNLGGVPLAWFRNASGDDVAVLSVDALALPALDFLKIDAEMMEVRVLRGARHTLQTRRPYVFLENESLIRGEYEQHDRLLLLLDSLGYVCHWLHVPLFRPDNHFRNPVLIWNYPVGVYAHNMLCAHYARPLRTTLETVALSGRTALRHADAWLEEGEGDEGGEGDA